MIHATRLLLAACCFAPVIAWAATGSQAAAWGSGISAAAVAWTARVLVRAKGSDARP